MFVLRPTLAAAALALSFGAAHAASFPNGVVYSANEGDGSISEITLRAGGVRTEQIPIVPHNVQIAPDGRTLLAVGSAKTSTGGHDGHHGNTAGAGQDGKSADRPDAAMLILGADRLAVRETLPSGEHPAHVVASRDGRYAYITNADADRVSAVDIRNGKIVAQIRTDAYPHGLRLSPDGRHLYVANVKGNSVSVIDTRSLAEAARIPVGKAPVQVAFTADGKQVYVSLRDENSVAVIDTATREVVGKIGVGRGPIQLYAAGRDLMYVANQGSESDPDDTVSVIDTRRKSLIRTVTTGKGAHGVVASDDGRFVFVTNSVDNTVSAIDTGSQEVVATYPVGPNPNGISYRRVR